MGRQQKHLEVLYCAVRFYAEHSSLGVKVTLVLTSLPAVYDVVLLLSVCLCVSVTCQYFIDTAAWIELFLL